MPVFQINLDEELRFAREENTKGEPINVAFMLPQYRRFSDRLESELKLIVNEMDITIDEIKKSPAFYAATSDFFFVEHIKNAKDAGATQLRLFVNIDPPNIICTLIDNGKGFKSFLKPEHPTLEEYKAAVRQFDEDKVALASNSEQLDLAYIEFKKLEAAFQLAENRRSAAGVTGFADYRKIIDPTFDPAVGEIHATRSIASDKLKEKETKKQSGGQGIGISAVTKFLHRVSGGQGTIEVGNVSDLRSGAKPEFGISVGQLPKETDGAAIAMESPLYSPDLVNRVVINEKIKLQEYRQKQKEFTSTEDEKYSTELPILLKKDSSELQYLTAIEAIPPIWKRTSKWEKEGLEETSPDEQMESEDQDSVLNSIFSFSFAKARAQAEAEDKSEEQSADELRSPSTGSSDDSDLTSPSTNSNTSHDSARSIFSPSVGSRASQTPKSDNLDTDSPRGTPMSPGSPGSSKDKKG